MHPDRRGAFEMYWCEVGPPVLYLVAPASLDRPNLFLFSRTVPDIRIQGAKTMSTDPLSEWKLSAVDGVRQETYRSQIHQRRILRRPCSLTISQYASRLIAAP